MHRNGSVSISVYVFRLEIKSWNKTTHMANHILVSLTLYFFCGKAVVIISNTGKMDTGFNLLTQTSI